MTVVTTIAVVVVLVVTAMVVMVHSCTLTPSGRKIEHFTCSMVIMTLETGGKSLLRISLRGNTKRMER